MNARKNPARLGKQDDILSSTLFTSFSSMTIPQRIPVTVFVTEARLCFVSRSYPVNLTWSPSTLHRTNLISSIGMCDTTSRV